MNHTELRFMIEDYLKNRRGETGVPSREPDISALIFDLKGSLPEGFPNNGKSWAYDCTIRYFAPVSEPEPELPPLDDDEDSPDQIVYEDPANWCLRLQRHMFTYLLAYFIDHTGMAGAIQKIISAAPFDGFVRLYGEEIDYRYHDLKSVAECANQARRYLLFMAEQAGAPCSIPEFIPQSPEWIEILNAESPYEI